VLPNPYAVEYGRFSSGLVVIQTRRAGDKWKIRLNSLDPAFRTERYHDWCAEHLGHLDELVAEWVGGSDFDRLLVETVQATYPAHEHEQFLAHFRGLIGMWRADSAPVEEAR